MADSKKKLVPRGKTTTANLKGLKDDGTELTSPKDIGDHFKNFVVNVGVTLALKFSSDSSRINPPVSNKMFNLPQINQKSINDQTLKLKNDKATSLDEIGTKLLTAGSPVLSIYLAQIFGKWWNYTIMDWKMFQYIYKVILKMIQIILDLSAS